MRQVFGEDFSMKRRKSCWWLARRSGRGVFAPNVIKPD
jgi:hypothetical protein